MFSALLTGLFIIDSGMNYLQSDKDPWRIPLSSGQVHFQILALMVGATLGYLFGFNLAMSLPNTQPNEPLVLAWLFSALASVFARAYPMLHFHRKINTTNPYLRNYHK
jgi:hypothetical protein